MDGCTSSVESRRAYRRGHSLVPGMRRPGTGPAIARSGSAQFSQKAGELAPRSDDLLPRSGFGLMSGLFAEGGPILASEAVCYPARKSNAVHVNLIAARGDEFSNRISQLGGSKL